MRPFRSFLLLFIILASLTGLFYLFQDIKLAPSPEEYFPSFNKLFGTGSEQTTLKTGQVTQSDTIRIVHPEPLVETGSSGASTYGLNTYLLAPFIDSLKSSKGQIRVMYYGDSQVEGDRITFYLRKLLRQGRNGTGPGLFLPVMPVMYTKSLWVRSSPEWERYNYLSYRSGEISHSRLGPFMAFCRYLPEGRMADSPVKATVRVRPSGYADSASFRFDILRIFYSNKSGRVDITIKNGSEKLFSDTLVTGSGLHEIDFDINGTNDLIIEFEGRVSPDIFGISIESRHGIIVDNIPQRGSAGLEFTMVDRKNLEESYSLLSPDLIVLHYGLNIVRNVRNDYSYYKRGLIRQIKTLNELAPSATVLVVGLTDMATNEGDTIKSFSNIPLIIEAQKQASSESGAVFWDSYMAMGGSSSIISWKDRKPPLAQKDYIHFTYAGSDTLSALLVKEMFLAKINDSVRADAKEIVPEIKAAGVQPAVIEVAERSSGKFFRDLVNYDPDKPLIFTTPAFWLFMLFVLFFYSLIYKKLFLRNLYLLLVSLFFYYKSGGLFIILLILVIIIDFSCGLLIYRSRKKFFKWLFIVVSIVSNLGILAYFKYAGFLVSTINDILGTQIEVNDFLAAFSNSHLGTSFDISNIILPVGISFFTFQSLSYTIDVFRGKMEPVRNILDFGFYVSFFPQLVAGPIVRASEFIPQLYAQFTLSKREFSHALFLIQKGLIKKIIISDFIATGFIDRVFEMPAVYSGFENLMAIYGYGLQIYCDFSGYTDIAIGIALIMGFRLPINFNSPYKASSPSDFWRRWHISLSRWLKDYLYIPLGGNRKGKFRSGINLIITMLLGGLWHGASVRFIIWGGLHGLGLVITRIWNSIIGHKIQPGWAGRALGVFITFNFVSFCWIFFRASDSHTAFLMLTQIAENFSPGSYLTVLTAYSSIFLLIAAGYMIHLLPEKIKESYRGVFIRIPVPAQVVVILLVAVMLYQMRLTGVVPFIYFRF